MDCFTLYLYRFESTAGFGKVSEILKSFEGKAGITNLKFTDEKNEEKIRKINGIILSERSRRFDEHSLYDMYITVVEYTNNRFFAIVSALADRFSSVDILKLFQRVNPDTEICYFNTGSSETESGNYWRGIISEFTMAGKKNLKEKTERDFSIALPLKLKSMKKFDTLLKEDPLEAKVLLSAAVARLMCFVNDSAGLIFEDVHDGGRLSKIPVRCNDTVGTYAERKALYEYFQKSEFMDAIDFGTIAKFTNIDLYNAPLFSQSFVCESSYSEYFLKMKVAGIYLINPLDVGNVPMHVTYRMHEDERSIQYEFDRNFFANINIEGFHEAVGLLVDAYMIGAPEPVVDKLLHKENDLARKIEELKMKCLKSDPAFKDFSNSELERISKKSIINQFFCQQDVIERNAVADKVYMIVSGKIQVNGVDMEGISKPLYILKERDVFGFESLGLEKKAFVSYCVYTDQCVLLALNSKDILEERMDHPELIRSAVDIQNKLLLKFEKLWMMS